MGGAEGRAELISAQLWTGIWIEEGSCPTGTLSAGPLSWSSYGPQPPLGSDRRCSTLWKEADGTSDTSKDLDLGQAWDTSWVHAWDVVDLPAAVMLQSTAAATAAAASAAATVLGTAHPHQAAGHRQLGGLGKVGQDASRRVGQAALQGGLWLRSLRTQHTAQGLTHHTVEGTLHGIYSISQKQAQCQLYYLYILYIHIWRFLFMGHYSPL